MKLVVFACLLVIIPFQAKASCIGADVEVLVANGSGLTGDGPRNPDPYVVVTIGKDRRKTKVIKSKAHPDWWETFQFQDVSSDVMKIEVWDDDRLSSDDHLGTCPETLTSKSQDLKPIQCRTLDKGFVKLFYKCHGM